MLVAPRVGHPWGVMRDLVVQAAPVPILLMMHAGIAACDIYAIGDRIGLDYAWRQ